MKRTGFSMIELVFVIVILGVLAAVAVPRFLATRVDAQVATYRSDIATALKQIPAAVFANNLDPKISLGTGINSDYTETTDWGEFMIKVAGLDRTRWDTYGASAGRGIAMKVTTTTTAGGGASAVCGGGPIIYLNSSNGRLYFNPDILNNDSTAVCSALANTYASGSNREIIMVESSVKF